MSIYASLVCPEVDEIATEGFNLKTFWNKIVEFIRIVIKKIKRTIEKLRLFLRKKKSQKSNNVAKNTPNQLALSNTSTRTNGEIERDRREHEASARKNEIDRANARKDLEDAKQAAWEKEQDAKMKAEAEERIKREQEEKNKRKLARGEMLFKTINHKALALIDMVDSISTAIERNYIDVKKMLKEVFEAYDGDKSYIIEIQTDPWESYLETKQHIQLYLNSIGFSSQDSSMLDILNRSLNTCEQLLKVIEGYIDKKIYGVAADTDEGLRRVKNILIRCISTISSLITFYEQLFA